MFVLIRWEEEPPKWDVVSIKDILNDGEVKAGVRVEANYNGDIYPATVVATGSSKGPLQRKLDLLTEELYSSHVSSSESDQERGKGQRKKKKKTYEDCEDKDSALKAGSKKAPNLKQVSKKRTESVLNTLREGQANCSSCDQKEAKLLRLETRLEQLENLDSIAASFDASLARLEKLERKLEHKSSQSANVQHQRSEVAREPATTPSQGRNSDMAAREAAASPVTGLEPDMVTIGPCTRLPATVYRGINWLHPDKRKAARDLLVAVFGRELLASSSLTGTIGHANRDKGRDPKPALDPTKVNDCLNFLLRKTGLPIKEGRHVFRQKLNDEAKLKGRKTKPAE